MSLRLDAAGPATDLFRRRDDRRFTLLVFGPAPPTDAARRFGALVEVLAVPEGADNDAALDAARVPRPSFYLLRPDGHVGLSGREFDAAAIERYLAERVRLA